MPNAAAEEALALFGRGPPKMTVAYHGIGDDEAGLAYRFRARDGLLGADQTEKQQFVSAAEEVASGAMWRRLKGLRDGGHLLGALLEVVDLPLQPLRRCAARLRCLLDFL